MDTDNIRKETGLTPQEAGELIGCSAYTVKELARGNRIPFYRLGSRYLFTRAALMDWITNQEKNNYHKEDQQHGKYKRLREW